MLSPAEERANKMRRTGTAIGGSGGAAKGRVKEAVVDAGHMAPLEEPEQVGDLVAAWFGEEIRRWKKEQEFWRSHDPGKSDASGSRVSELWKERVKLPANAERPVKEKL